MRISAEDSAIIMSWLEQNAANVGEIAAEAGVDAGAMIAELHEILIGRAREELPPFADGRSIAEALGALLPLPTLRELSPTWRSTLTTLLNKRREQLRRSARAMARRCPRFGDAQDFEAETYLALTDRALLGRAPFSSGSHLPDAAISPLHATRMARDRLRAGVLATAPIWSSDQAEGSEDEILDDLLILDVQQRVRAAITICFENRALKHDWICALVHSELIDHRLAADSFGVDDQALEVWRQKSDDARRQDRHRGKTALIKTFREYGLDREL